MTKTTTQYLEEKGYKYYESMKQYSDALYQKKFSDENGVKYFISVDHYDFHNITMPEEARRNYEFEYSTQLVDKVTHCPVQITLFAGWQIDDVEKHLEDLFETGLYKYYEE